jgi:AcrR family transcriptional regulator
MATRSSATGAVLELAQERPELGVVRAARELRRQGVRLSPSGVRAIWQRHGLATSYERLMSRKRGTGATAALSESQHALLRRMKVSRRFASQTSIDPTQGRRDQLIAAAARVLGEKGYERASLQEICAAAGILPGSLYYHFTSKGELFVTVHAEGFRQLNEAVDRAVAQHADPWRKLEAACAAHLALLVDSEGDSLFAGTSLFHPARPPLQRRLNRDRNAYEERFRQMIGALPLPEDVDQTLLRLTLLGALNWTRVWYRSGGKGPQEIARHLVHGVLRRSLDPDRARPVRSPRAAAERLVLS